MPSLWSAPPAEVAAVTAVVNSPASDGMALDARGPTPPGGPPKADVGSPASPGVLALTWSSSSPALGRDLGVASPGALVLTYALNSLALGLGLAAASSWLVVAFVWAMNQALSEAARRGDEVRLPSEGGEGAVHPAALLGGLVSLLYGLTVVVTAGNCMLAFGRRADRRTWMIWIAALVCLTGLHLGERVARVSGERWAFFVRIVVAIVALYLTMMDLHRQLPPGKQFVSRFAFEGCLVCLIYAIVYTFLIIPHCFTHSAGHSDAAALATRLAVHPLLTQVVAVQLRRVARQAPPAESGRLLVPLQALLAMSSLAGRLMILNLEDTEMAVLCLLLVPVTELVLRACEDRLDALYLRLLGAPAEDLASQPQVAAHVLEPIFEIWATATATATFIAFRAGSSQAAPSAAGIALMGLAMLATEALVAFGPVAVRAACGSVGRADRRVLRRLTNALRPDLTHTWVGLLITTHLSLIWLLGVLGDAESQVSLCAWSKNSSGWWHRVPCGLAEEWLS